MPVLKLPIIHKFGIISHSQRLQLQSRIVDDITSSRNEPNQKAQKNPFELTEEFIISYNDAVKGKVKHKKAAMLDLGRKIFLKSERRIGLKFNGENEPQINLALAWTELSILSQCEDNLGLDSLNVLIKSLQISPVNLNCFNVLFYLLENALYFTQIDEIRSIMPTRHLKWLKIGELVAIRIYIMNKLENIELDAEIFDNIQIYMKTFPSLLSQFHRYPDVAVSFMVIEKVVKFLLDRFTENGKQEEEHEAGEKVSKQLEHDGSSLLWHCIDLWRCSHYKGLRSQLEESVSCTRHCLNNGIDYGNWLDCYLAVCSLANCSTFSKTGLDVFISLVYGAIEPHKNNRNSTNITANIENKDELPDKYNTQPITMSEFDILQLVIFREFSELPIRCQMSAEKEKSLSTLAEIIIDKSKLKNPELKIESQFVIMSQLSAIYDIIGDNEDNFNDDVGLKVICNSVWSLLRAMQQRWPRDQAQMLNDCNKYGKFLHDTIVIGNSVTKETQTFNLRVSRFLVENLLPVNFIGSSNSFLMDSSELNKSRMINNASKMPKLEKVRRKDIVMQINKKLQKTTSYQRPSNYSQKSVEEMQKITDHFWNIDLPELEEQIDVLQAQQEANPV